MKQTHGYRYTAQITLTDREVEALEGWVQGFVGRPADPIWSIAWCAFKQFPRTIKVDDLVMFPPYETPYRVRSVAEGWAWIFMARQPRGFLVEVDRLQLADGAVDE